MSNLASFRGMLCALGTLAALSLGGCMLDATGTGIDEESLGTETDELLAVEDEGAPVPGEFERGEQEQESTTEPDLFASFLGDGDDPFDPHPDPWIAMDTGTPGSSSDR